MSDVAIAVKNLSKSFRIAHQRNGLPGYRTLRDDLMGLPQRLLARWKRNGQLTSETFWALKDVSFEVKKGEVVGIIGRNGTGKSTLLKILSRITEPTSGGADIYGRVGALLEVGTGFHPELTGRENIFMNGAILGMKRVEIRRRFDEIVAFAEVEKFLDTPVKRYSSGMYVRLAFAVAAHLDPEILLVDEVLAVGDTEFQKKCLGKMHDVSQAGRTVIFISHSMEAISQLCPRAIWLDEGQFMADGPSDAVIAKYSGSTPTDSQALVPAKVQNATILITSMEISRAKWPGTQLCKLFRTESLLLHLSSTTLEDPDPLGGLKFFYRSVGKNRTTMYAELAAFLAGSSVARILCVPVSEEDLRTAVAITDISAAPLALYLTEAGLLGSGAIPLTAEAADKARVCLAISEEVKSAYQRNLGRKFWIFPPPAPEVSNPRSKEAHMTAKQMRKALWDALDGDTVELARVEENFAPSEHKLIPYVQERAPSDIYWEFRSHFQWLRRLSEHGYSPDFIVDVGASTGYWSLVAKRVFSKAKFYLVDPLLERYLEKEGAIYRSNPDFIRIIAAVGDQPGDLGLNVSEDLYGSSLFDASAFPDGRKFSMATVHVRTLEEIARAEKISGHGMLKIDVQFSEHLVLSGAGRFLQQVDFVLVEVSTRKFTPQNLTVEEFLAFMRLRGFRYADFAGEWRDPVSGELLQQDLVFARESEVA